MKKFLFMLCAAVISFCSCSNDDPADPGNNPGGNGALLEEVFKEGTVSEITQTAIFPEGDAEMVTTFAYNGKGFDIKKFTVTHDGKDMTGEIDGKMDYTIERVDNSVIFNYANLGSLTCDMASKTYFIKGYVPAVKSLKINGKEYFPEFTNVTPASEKIDELFKDQSIITIVVPEDDDPTYIYKLELLYYAVTEEYRVKSFIGGETDLTEEAKEFVKAENVDGVFKMTMDPDGTLTIDPVKKTYMREGKISPISDILVNGESIIGQLTEEKPTVSNAYLVFTAAEDGQKIDLSSFAGREGYSDFEFSVDGGAWGTVADCVGSIPFYNKKLYLRGKFAKGTQGATIEFTNSDIKVACEGDLRTWVNWENPESVTGEGLKFHYLFSGCKALTSAPDMPFTKWTETSCCEAMFQDCISLTKAPALPATQLAECCYRAMFKGCSSLVEVSQNMLPATQLSTNCYRFMFEGCSSLTKAPDLLAPALADYCYGAMFNGCSKLSYVKMLATQNAMQAVRDMMRNAGRGTEPTTTRTFIWESREAYYRLDYDEMEFDVEWLFLDKNGDPLFPDEED